MIKITEADPKKLKEAMGNTKFLLTGNIEGELLQDTELIPIDVSGRLIPQGISINELGKQLLKASGEGNVNEIRTLMGKGAPFTADWLGTSPLHLAAQNNHLDVCEILLKAGISKDAITKVARTPLHMASYEGHIEIVDCLLKHGADYDCRDMLEMTPLHWAAQNGHAEVVTLLIRYGACTNPVNKFDLTPADLALQIKRQDILEIINIAIRDPLIATQHLQLEMTSDSNDTMDVTEIRDGEVNYVPIQTVSLEDVDSEGSVEQEQIIMPEAEPEEQIEDLTDEIAEAHPDPSINESFKYLQEHGITMLPADDSNILSTVMESGHSVVLTDVGKQVLNSLKQTDNASDKLIPAKPPALKENSVTTFNTKKIITVTPEEFLAMTTNGTLSNNFIKQVNTKFITFPKNNFKRIVMKKNKTTPITTTTINISKVQKPPDLSSDVESLKKQLLEAHTLIEEYKIKLRKKEIEAERYRQQLKILLDSQ